MPDDIVLSTYDMTLIANGLRAAVDFGISGYAIVANNNNSTLTGNNELAFSKRTILTTWTTVEFAFFTFITLHLTSRWIWKCKNEDSELTPGGMNVLMVRIFIAMCSLTSAILLTCDLNGNDSESVAGVSLITITSFLTNFLIERFKKKEAEQQATTASLLTNTILYQDGYITNMEYAYTPNDVKLVWESTVKHYDGSAQPILDGTNYKITKNGGSVNQTVLVSPPVISRPAAALNFENGLGHGSASVFFADADANNHLGNHIMHQVQTLFSDNQDKNVRILFPCQGLDENVADRWWSVEINI